MPCPPPEDLPNPGIKHTSPALQVNSLPTEPPGKLTEISSMLGYIFFSVWLQVQICHIMVHFQYDNLKPMTLVPKVSIIRHLPHFRNLRSLGTKCLTQGKINSVICKTESGSFIFTTQCPSQKANFPEYSQMLRTGVSINYTFFEKRNS